MTTMLLSPEFGEIGVSLQNASMKIIKVDLGLADLINFDPCWSLS